MQNFGILDVIKETYQDQDFYILDGLDDAIIGVDEQQMRIIYSVTKCIEVIMEQNDLSKEDACEYFYYNVDSLRISGQNTPILCHDNF
jgi:hypothetical protein